MSARIVLDHGLLLARRPGQPDRLERHHLQARVGRLAAISEELDDAAESGVLPHMRPTLHADAVSRGEAWAEAPEDLVLLGDPGAVAGCGLLSPRPLDAIVQPDPATVRALLPSGRAVRLLVLDGPPWVRRVATALASRSTHTTVVVGDGTTSDGWTLPGAARWEAPASADARFAPFSPAAQALAVSQGLDFGPLLEVWEATLPRIQARGLWDNPALLLAGVADAMAETGMPRVALLAGSDHLLRWATWARACWSAVSIKSDGGATVRRTGGAVPLVGTVGDESLAQRLIDGTQDTWSMVLREAPGARDLPLGAASTIAELGRQVEDAQVTQLAQVGRPVLRLRVSDSGTPAALALAATWVHAALALALLRGLPPLAMPAADRLRAIQRRWAEDADPPGSE